MDETSLIPNALWGSFADAPGPQGYDRLRVRARSPSFTDSLVQRFIAACKSWGNSPGPLPPAGALLQVPTVTEAQTVATLPGLPKGSSKPPNAGILAISVRGIGKDHSNREGALGFHGAYLSQDTFAAMDDQSFGLWQSGVFMEGWDGNDDLSFIEIQTTQAKPPAFSPVADPQADVLVKELRHILKGGDVIYNFQAPDGASDEHLRILQLGFPRKLRISVGFCTFFGTSLYRKPTVRGDDTFGLCAIPGSGRFEAGRGNLAPSRRRPMSGDGAIEEYVDAYREALRSGDPTQLTRLSRAGVQHESIHDTKKKKWNPFPWLQK